MKRSVTNASRAGGDPSLHVCDSVKRIALLGAPGTGKTRLARDLAAHLQSSAGDLLFLDGTRTPDCEATLLLGLDLPSAAGGEAADAQLREALQSAGVAYQVVYGTGAQRLQSALVALASAGVLPAGLAPRREEGGATRAWTWICEKCSDPACEHRLFTRLRQEREAPAAERDA